MNSEDTSTIAIEPFIREFTFQIISAIARKKYSMGSRHVIDADLIPRLSGRAIAHQQKKPSQNFNAVQPPRHTKLATKPNPNFQLQHRPQRQQPRRQFIPPRFSQPKRFQQEPAVNQEEYGKITPLINDPSVQQIECAGAGKEVLVVRLGQKQITRITLTAGEISALVENISNKAHIPLLNGVFRAAVDHLLISAVISEMIGTRFVIKKQVQ